MLDVIVIGAGAAGLLAAARAAERGRRTLLIEKNRKPGVKILISGGTRCNLTHDCDVRGIVAAFGSAGPFLHSPLAALGPRELVTLFHAEGLPTKVEPTGKIFPQSDRALDVVQALLRRLQRSGAELALGEGVTGIVRDGDGFRVSTSRSRSRQALGAERSRSTQALAERPNSGEFGYTPSESGEDDSRELFAAKLIVCAGGRSFPGCGTTGDAYGWLKSLGHTIRRPRPALVPLISEDGWVRELSGVTIPDVLLRVVDPTADTARKRRGLPAGVKIERRGSLLFAHFGLTGPAVLDVSRAMTGTVDPRSLWLVADFLPDTTPAQLEEQLRLLTVRDGKKQAASVVAESLPRRLMEALFVQAGIPLNRRAAELSKAERAALIEWIKGARICVTGNRGFEKAEVTAGGVDLAEVDSRTMQSKLVPNLYLAGEVLDLDGFIGGYNFQAAFSTGWLAGSSV